MVERNESALEEHDLTIPAELAGQRLDAALARLLEGQLTRSRILDTLESLLRNGQTAKPSTKVQAGDRILVRLTVPPAFPDALPESIPLDVVYEDPHIVIINKPWGMPVHPSHGHPGGTLVNALLFRYPDLPGKDDRPGIIHRLDKDTSGLIVCARSAAALREMTALFKARLVNKEYTAIVKGLMHPQEGLIEYPLGRHPRNRKKQAVVAQGKEAKTGYRTLTRFHAASLLEIRLFTGRTHQIRVHLAHAGCPVLGDPIYARVSAGFPRLCLAATALSFTHPFTNLPVSVSIPLPQHMEEALTRLAAQSP